MLELDQKGTSADRSTALVGNRSVWQTPLCQEFLIPCRSLQQLPERLVPEGLLSMINSIQGDSTDLYLLMIART